MVFGLFEGGIELLTDKTSYSLGDTVTGVIRMKLKKPKKAKALELRFWGEVTKTSVGFSSGKTSTTQKTEKINFVSIPLKGEQEYFQEEVKFEFALPKQNEIPDLGGIGNAVLGFAKALAPKPKWFLEACLDVPMSIDISKKIQLNIV
ncbi:MAG: hypothetical protein ABH803_01905 [Candidatus Micrarchaeota archaeon]